MERKSWESPWDANTSLGLIKKDALKLSELKGFCASINGGTDILSQNLKKGPFMSLKRIMENCDVMSRYFSIVGGWTVLGLSVFVSIDVVIRKLFALTLQGTDEIGGYVMACVCAFGFSYALAERAHIRLTIIAPRLPKAGQIIVNLLAYIIFLAFAYMLFWQGFVIVKDSIQLKAVSITPLATPLVIPQSIWLLGLAWLSVYLTLYLIQFIGLLTKKKFTELLTTFGT